MDVEPTQALGPPPDDGAPPAETVADQARERPDPLAEVPTVGFGDAEPTQHPGNGKPTPPQPTGESPTDMAPPTIESFARPHGPLDTQPHRPGRPGDADETVNLPTDDDWSPSNQGPNDNRGPTHRGSGASYDTIEADGQFYEGQLVFNRYIVQKEVGRGGMGAVWLVKHRELNVDRALKVIVARIAYDAQARSRFKLEAQVMASFHHSNAVVVHDARLTENDVAYIDMEYVQGRSLAEMLTKGVPMPLEWIARILDQLCDVLQLAHRKKIVHRDLKPANLMLLDGYDPGHEHLKVLDFGIAKILKDAEDTAAGPKTMTGVFLGTPFYASPEQADNRADTRSDIYSVGVILYEFLTGFRPFSGPGPRVLVDVMTKPPPSFAEVNPEVRYPPEVEALVMRCLAKKPDDRPQTAREVAELFRAVALPGTLIDRPHKPEWDVRPPQPWLARNFKSIAAVCTLAVAMAFVVRSLKPKPPNPTLDKEVPVALPLLPDGFAAEPKSPLDEHNRPMIMVRTGEAQPPGMRFMLLHGKTFTMGPPLGMKLDPMIGLPAGPHEETVGDFAISDTEVTNGQMRAYYQTKGITPPAEFEKAIGKLKPYVDEEWIDKHPAVSVPRSDMVNFARWVGGDLPTSAQWEYAARSCGQDDRCYAWADAIPPKRKLTADSRLTNIGVLEAGETTTTTVKNFQKDQTDQAVFDMMGNVREWCRDAADELDHFLVRGGSYRSFPEQYSNFGREARDAADILPDLGFRVVVEMPPVDRRGNVADRVPRPLGSRIRGEVATSIRDRMKSRAGSLR